VYFFKYILSKSLVGSSIFIFQKSKYLSVKNSNLRELFKVYFSKVWLFSFRLSHTTHFRNQNSFLGARLTKSWISPYTAKYYKILQNTATYHKNTTKYCKILQNTTKLWDTFVIFTWTDSYYLFLKYTIQNL
jgi:hypothetical protein